MIVFLDTLTLGGVDLSGFDKFGEVVKHEITEPDQRRERTKDATVIVTNKVVIDSEVLDSAKHLKLVLVSATGINNIDLEACKARGVAVANVAGYSTASVVSHTFALYFYLAHSMDFYAHYDWSKSPIFTDLSHPFCELDGKKWGVVGMGEIGRKVASIATAFGASVCYTSTSGKNLDQPYKRVELDELISSCDVVSIHAPLTDQTRNLIAINELKSMKNGAILLNLGRGGIVNESDLAQVLKRGRIKAGLDVLKCEPPSANHPLNGAPNLLITPHIAWGSVESRERLVNELISNLSAFLEGKERNRVDV